MPRQIDLSSPECEPTDEELAELAHRAFSQVSAKSDAATHAFRVRIEAERERVRAELESKLVRLKQVSRRKTP
ncbi:MAG: hypothetical protein MUC96_00335 [Myxococcaceae bacterium]|jgi:hypothetical protein|nr:hypothetical protein [Myxococcaceae bacterium]